MPVGVAESVTPGPLLHRAPPVATTVGCGLMVTVTEEFCTHAWKSVTVTVYVRAPVKPLAMGFAMFVADSPAAGAHEYV